MCIHIVADVATDPHGMDAQKSVNAIRTVRCMGKDMTLVPVHSGQQAPLGGFGAFSCPAKCFELVFVLIFVSADDCESHQRHCRQH